MIRIHLTYYTSWSTGIGVTRLGASPAALVLGFNRPKKLKDCLSAVVDAGITNVYVSLDAPRFGNERDVLLCDACLEVVDSFRERSVKINLRVSEENLGCKYGPIAGIDWFFEYEEFGMIIEDDIIVTPEFVKFVSANQYLSNQGFWHINGWSMFNSDYKISGVYESCFPIVWGWATWRNCWQKLELEIDEQFLKSFPQLKLVANASGMGEFEDFWTEIFNNAGSRDAWDYYWVYSIWKYGGSVLAPPFSLAKNIGFDVDATHTKNSNRLLRGSLLKSSRKFDFQAKPVPDNDLDLITGKLIYGINVSEKALAVSSMRIPSAGTVRVLAFNIELLMRNEILKCLAKSKRLVLCIFRIRRSQD